ncbi:TPA: hypothetical protein ACH3X2_007048 [Trebouxia sp. C0005]
MSVEQDVIDIDVDREHESGDNSADQSRQLNNVSVMYAQWDFKPAAMRSSSHRGAYCSPCMRNGHDPGPKGHCLADKIGLLTHVKFALKAASGLQAQSGNKQKLS